MQDFALAPVLEWIDQRRTEIIEDLRAFCRQPSVAAAGWGMEEMVALLTRRLGAISGDVRQLATGGFPAVLATVPGAAAYRLGIYNHYDVQPPEPLERWSVPPFEAAIREGKLYARGVADNKGNLVARIWAVQAWQAVHGAVPCGVLFLVEGEEEIGSPHLGAAAAQCQDALRPDSWLWEAGYREASGELALYGGVKGILCVELRARTVAYDLHSSQAPLAPNAAWRLVDALASLHDAAGAVSIPGFYDAARPPTAAERALLARFPLDAAALEHQWQSPLLGAAAPADAAALTERLLFAPTCNINGIWGGYAGPGVKTVLPAEAGAKLDFRLVPDQDPAAILAGLREHLRAGGFADIEVVELDSASRPAQSPVDTPLMLALAATARQIYGQEPRILPRIAGTGPMEELCQRYGVPAVGGAGVGYVGSRIHAPDEHIRLDDLILGVKHAAALLGALAAGAGAGE